MKRYLYSTVVIIIAGFLILSCQRSTNLLESPLTDNPGLTSLAKNAAANNQAQNGFNEFGYNYNARIFVGAADGVDKVLDGKV